MKTQARPPTAVAARKPNARFCMFMARLSCIRLYFSGIEGCGQPLLLVVVPRTFPEFRAADAGRAMLADDLATGVLADQVVEEDVLGDDGVAFHAHHLGDVGDAARTVAQARRLDDDVDRRADHFANGSRRKRK